MLTRIKSYIIIALVIGAFYFLLSHHFVITGHNFAFVGWDDWDDLKILKKNELTLKYTFFSLKQANPYQVMRIEELRDAGIGKIMIEKGIVTDEKMRQITQKIDSED